MAQTQYTIIEERTGTFTVEVRDRGRPPIRNEGFRTREQANAYILEQKQMAAAADKWEATRIGQMHKDE